MAMFFKTGQWFRVIGGEHKGAIGKLGDFDPRQNDVALGDCVGGKWSNLVVRAMDVEAWRPKRGERVRLLELQVPANHQTLKIGAVYEVAYRCATGGDWANFKFTGYTPPSDTLGWVTARVEPAPETPAPQDGETCAACGSSDVPKEHGFMLGWSPNDPRVAGFEDVHQAPLCRPCGNDTYGKTGELKVADAIRARRTASTAREVPGKLFALKHMASWQRTKDESALFRVVAIQAPDMHPRLVAGKILCVDSAIGTNSPPWVNATFQGEQYAATVQLERIADRTLANREVPSGAPETLPKTLPVGCKSEAGSVFLTEARLGGLTYTVERFRTVDGQENRGGSWVPGNIDWPSYHRALTQQETATIGRIGDLPVCAGAPESLASRFPESHGSRCGFCEELLGCHETVRFEPGPTLHLHCSEQLSRRRPECPRCGKPAINLLVDCCDACGVTGRELHAARSRRNGPDPYQNFPHGMNEAQICLAQRVADDVQAALSRRRQTAQLRAELDRESHPRAWPEAAYLDAPDGEL